MSVGILFANTMTAGLTSPVTTAETVCFTTPPLVSGLAGVLTIRITGVLNITPGAASTAVTLRLRQGTTVAGAQVTGAAPVHTSTAGSAVQIPFAFSDRTTYLESSQQYSLTIQQTSATGNGTVNALDIKVEQ